MSQYRGIFKIDTSFFNRLDGRYCIEEYTLIPCVFTPENQQRMVSNFVLLFSFEGKDEKSVVDIEEKGRIWAANMAYATEKARIFVSWLVTATNHWARLSCDLAGPAMRSGPGICSPTSEFDESRLFTSYNIDQNADHGKFCHVDRPCFERATSGPDQSFKLTSDFHRLTRKLFSLEKGERDKLLNACMSYQFALETWAAYPTISVLALVSAVESMMAGQYTSGYCDKAETTCSLKADVMKKFRMFFERTLAYPLPEDLQKFLNKVYSRRSLFVHRFLLGGEGIRAIPFLFASSEGRELMDEHRHLSSLVNAALVEWLRRI